MPRIKMKRTKPSTNLFKMIWDKMTVENFLKKRNPELFESKKKIPWTIYTAGNRMDKHQKQFSWIHYTLKNRIIIPLLYIVEKYLHGKLDKNVPKEIYNNNLMIFNDSFESAIEKWGSEYLIHTGCNARLKKDAKWWKRNVHKNGSARLLRTAKNLTLTVGLNDTAYREFLNIWVFEIAKKYAEVYKDKKQIHHLMYTDHISTNVFYYKMYPVVQQRFEIAPAETPEDRNKKAEEVIKKYEATGLK